MELRCKVCQAVQPVTCADEADEDPRTRSIRQAFRAEHAACGDGAVSFQAEHDATCVDPECWPAYLAHVQAPADVVLGADGFFTRSIVRDGVTHHVRVCEGCWQNIPRYVDCPAGLISPESDGDGVIPGKCRPDTVDTSSPNRAAAAAHLWKAVCIPCYVAAFRRVYPDAVVPTLCTDVVGDGEPVEPLPPVPAEELGRSMLFGVRRPVGVEGDA